MNSPHYEDDLVTLHHGDCIAVLRELPDNSVDAVVTDPPYGLEFMGKDWDAPWQQSDVNADAGFNEIAMADGATRLPRPSFTGSTNPKCLVCKGTRRGRRDGTAKVAVCLCEDGGQFPNVRAVEMKAFQTWCTEWATECLRILKPGGHILAFGGSRTWHRLAAAIEDAGFEIRDSIAWLYGSGFPKSMDVSKAIAATQAGYDGNSGAIRRATMGDAYEESGRRGNRDGAGRRDTGLNEHDLPLGEAAQEWAGWGTALKPAFEPIVVGRKPLAGTVAANVLEHGTGALNIDACRVAGDNPSIARRQGSTNHLSTRPAAESEAAGRIESRTSPERYAEARAGEELGRWPTNVLLDDHQAAELDAESGELKSGALKPYRENHDSVSSYKILNDREKTYVSAANSGGASRFFPVFRWQAKAPKRERPSYTVAGVEVPSTTATGFGQVRTRQCNVCGSRSCPSNYLKGDPRPWPACGHDDWSWVDRDVKPGEAMLQSKPMRRCNVCGNKSKPGGYTKGDQRPWPTCGHDDWSPYVADPPTGQIMHPTVKPLDLMRWLVRLVTPPGAIVLEPFAGSGTTAEACVLEDRRCIAIEREADYLPLIVSRLRKPQQQGLFDLGGTA